MKFDFKSKETKSSLALSLTLIFYIAFRLLVGTALSLLYEVLPENIYVDTILEALFYSAMLFVPCLVFIKLDGNYISTGLKDAFAPWHEEEPDYLPFFTLRGIELGIIAAIVANFVATLLYNYGFANPLPEESFPFAGDDYFGIFLYVISVAILPGILEELFFRGIIMKHFIKYGKVCAAFVSAVCFGLLHFYPAQILFAFLFGLIIAFYDFKYGSIKIGIILHMVNNYISVIFDLMLDNMEYSKYASIVLAFYLTIIVLGIISKLVIKHFDLKFGKNDDIMGTEKKTGALRFLLSPPMFIFYACVVYYIALLS